MTNTAKQDDNQMIGCNNPSDDAPISPEKLNLTLYVFLCQLEKMPHCWPLLCLPPPFVLYLCKKIRYTSCGIVYLLHAFEQPGKYFQRNNPLADYLCGVTPEPSHAQGGTAWT